MNSILSARLTFSEAAYLAAKLIALYPNGGSNAGKAYPGALAEVLCAYPKSVAERAADPLQGIARTCKFLPTVADLVAWLEAETAPLHTANRTVDAVEATLARRQEPYQLPTRPVGNATRSGLMAKFDLPNIPRGWSAVDVTCAYQKHGRQFVVEAIKSGAPPPTPPYAGSLRINSALAAVMATKHKQVVDNLEDNTF